MATPFETFVNTELPKRLATNVSPTAPQAGEVPVFTGVGLLTENKAPSELGLATSSQLTDKADLVDGLVPANQLPSYVDDVLEYANLASFPLLGEASKLYIAIDTNLVYRWSGSTYAVTSSSLALGETLSTAYRGDRGKTAYNHSQLTGNPHGATTANINDSTDKRYVTDAQRTRVNTAASTSVDGYLTSTDWNTFNGKLKTINHTSAGTITLVPGYKVTQIISTAATMTLTGGVATDQSEIVRIIARADTVISLSGAIIGFGDGHTLNNIGTTYTVYKGETIDLFMPADTALYVHGQHIQDSGSLAIYKPTTNNKISFNLSALTESKTITFPDADVDLGTIVTAAQINWGFVGFGTIPAGLRITTASGAISQVDMSSVIVSSETLVNGLVHGARKSARYVIPTGSTFNVNLSTLAYPYYVQFEANHGGGTATLVITLAGITTFFDAKSATALGGSPLTIKITPGEVITIRSTTSTDFAIVDRSLDVGIASDDRVSSGYRAVFRAPTPFTENRTITVPNASINFGDLPSVATTNNNVLSGTRTFCLMGGGGSVSLGNKIQGTDTGAIGSTGCDMRGTRNVAYSSTRVGTDATATDNSFYNCSSAQPVELVTTIGVRYENCTYVQLNNTVTWPNYSRVVGSGDSNSINTVVYTRLKVISLKSTPQAMTTGGTGSNTEVVASGDMYSTALHDIVVIFTNLNDPHSTIMRRQVVVDSAGGIISNTTPVPDIVVGITVYTLSISVVSNKLRLTVQSNISSSSACNAEVISRYF